MASQRLTRAWHATGDALVLADRHPEDPPPPFRLPWFLTAACVFLVLLGAGLAIYSGYLMATGAPETSAPGSRGNIPRPAVFLLGLGLALSPVLIVRRERRSHGKFHATMTLTPGHVVVHNLYGRFMVPWPALHDVGLEKSGSRTRLQLQLDSAASYYRTVHQGAPLDTRILDDVSCADPEREWAVLAHYLSNVGQRRRIGSPESAAHANSLGS